MIFDVNKYTIRAKQNILMFVGLPNSLPDYIHFYWYSYIICFISNYLFSSQTQLVTHVVFYPKVCK